jgi:hypothetical protein
LPQRKKERKTKQIITADKDAGGKEPSYILGRNLN